MNRREFDSRLQRSLKNSIEDGNVHALCYLDLDQFKVVNDTCGHVAGDELLRQTANLLHQHIRARDTLARLGGDEFGILMEHCNAEQANRIAETLRHAIGQYRFVWEDKIFNVGASILKQFDESGVPPEKICLEITETAAIANLRNASRFAVELRSQGCRFALDDFGSGLSSFAYLKNLPVDYLKIDGVFVKSILKDPTDQAMVRSINEIGHVMDKQTIAEFAEDDEIIGCLREIGVDFAQGFGTGYPRPLKEIDYGFENLIKFDKI